MIECFAVHNAADNRIHHFVSEDHAYRYAEHLGKDVEVNLAEVTELSTMRRLGSEDHLAECEALLVSLGA